MPALVAEAACNPALGDLLHRFVDERRSKVRGILAKGQERGEVRDDVDIELVVDMFSAPVFYRRLLSGAPLRPADGQQIARLLLNGVGEKAQPRRRSRE
jgi:hypothetical protein